MTDTDVSRIHSFDKPFRHPTPAAIRMEIAVELAKDAADGNEQPIPARASSLIDKAIQRACLVHGVYP